MVSWGDVDTTDTETTIATVYVVVSRTGTSADRANKYVGSVSEALLEVDAHKTAGGWVIAGINAYRAGCV